MANVNQSTPSRVPILLLTGFLGSGKTSLLNRLMAARPASRGKIAIVVNEFGDVGIDGALLPSEMTRQVELPGGCICCVLSEDLDKTLIELLDGTPDVETVVIETTGIAEPLPISWALEREPLSHRIRLAAVITVVDVTQFEHIRETSPAVDAQVEYADILALSKMDLPGHEQPSESLTAALRALNPAALLVSGAPETVVSMLWQSIVDPELTSATADIVPSIVPSGVPSNELETASDHAGGQETHGHGHGHGAASGSVHGFDTVWLPIDDLIDFEELSTNLEELPANYIRIKGIARVIDESTGSSAPRWVAFHRVGMRVSCEPLAAPGPMRVVAIGPGVERTRLAACFNAAVVPSDSF